MSDSADKDDYEARLRSVIDFSSLEADLQALYQEFRSIVGPPEMDQDGFLKCRNCHEKYKETGDDMCLWYSDTHQGLFLCDFQNNDAWYGWHEGYAPMTSSQWKKDSADGKHKWTGCGCTHGTDQCERQDTPHRPEGYPPSPEEWCDEESAELSDDELSISWSRQRGQELLRSNYILELCWIIRKKKEKKEF